MKKKIKVINENPLEIEIDDSFDVEEFECSGYVLKIEVHQEHGFNIDDFSCLKFSFLPEDCTIRLVNPVIGNHFVVSYNYYQEYKYKKKYFEAYINFDLTETREESNWNASAFCEKFCEFISEYKNFKTDYWIVDNPAYEMYVSIDLENIEEENIGNGFYAFQRILLEIFKKTDDFLVRQIADYGSIELEFPHYLITPLKQYIYFFEDFVKFTKNEEIKMSLSTSDIGLKIKINHDKIPEDTLEKWFFDYLFFLKKNMEEIRTGLKYLKSLSKEDIINAVINQVTSFHKSAEFSRKLYYKNQIENPNQPLMLKDNIFDRKKELNNLIRIGRIEDALNLMKNEINFSATLKKDLVLLSSKYNTISKDFNNGLINYDELNLQKSKIIKGIINCISEME